MLQAWGNVNTLMKDIVPFLEIGKVSESQRTMPTGDITQISIDKYAKVFDFIDDLLKTEEWDIVQNAWSLCTPERWQFYKDHEIENLQEQNILDFACLKLARLWVKKPKGFFGRHEETPNENADFQDSE